MKLLRNILAIPVCAVAIFLIYTILTLVYWWTVTSLSSFWAFFVLATLAVLYWYIRMFLFPMLVALLGRISANPKYNAWTVVFLCIGCCVGLIYNSWTAGLDYRVGAVVFIVIVYNIFVVKITKDLIVSSMFALLLKN